MKALGILKTVVFGAIVLVSITGTQLNAQDKFVTNEVKTGELVTEKTIYKADGSLHRHMKYNYAYDNEGKMTMKEAFKWDGALEVWNPYYKITYQYTGNEIVMEYARWDDKSKDYGMLKERSVYEWNEANMPTAYMNYKWNASEKDWKLSTNYIYDDFLLALTK